MDSNSVHVKFQAAYSFLLAKGTLRNGVLEINSGMRAPSNEDRFDGWEYDLATGEKLASFQINISEDRSYGYLLNEPIAFL